MKKYIIEGDVSIDDAGEIMDVITEWGELSPEVPKTVHIRGEVEIADNDVAMREFQDELYRATSRGEKPLVITPATDKDKIEKWDRTQWLFNFHREFEKRRDTIAETRKRLESQYGKLKSLEV